MKTSEIAPLGVRMPPELKERLREAASENRRSLNAEVVKRLEQSLDTEKAKAPNA
jgi:predicted HicB family RNase H-like nuclease